jgi:quercetin dioxygenase-like cupin family protein
MVMRVIHFDAAERVEPEPDWKRASLCSQPEVSIEYFVKPAGHASPLHEHPQAQVTVVIEGKMIARTGDGEAVTLGPFDAAYFEPDEPHAVINALDTPSVGIDVFAPGRSFDFWLKRLRG